MKVRKAIITAAGREQRKLPLQTLTDGDGRSQTVLRLFIDELLSAGIEEIGVVVMPGDEAGYREAAGEAGEGLVFIEQAERLGYGHAVHCGKAFTEGEPFFLMVSDHLFVSDDAERSCARQLVEAAEREDCLVSAVQATHESKLSYFGAVGGKLFEGKAGVYEIERVMEKPTPTAAEQELMVPGLKLGHYLCFFGMHVLTPGVMDLLEAEMGAVRAAGEGRVQLSSAISQLAGKERCLAVELEGRRYDLEDRFGLLLGQLAVALDGGNRDEVLMGIIELLAQSKS
ncbi:MAG: sugar phosphate nucleotidyltransferase [Verrucomicrobiota bacterium]